MKKWISFLVAGLFLSGCSVAPIQNYHSAQSLGSGRNEIKLSSVAPGVSYDHGLTKNLDLGFGVESQGGLLANVRTKYSFVNRQNGLSFAGILGGGWSDDLGESKSAYIGPIVSYRGSSTEFFLGYRLNYVHMDAHLDRDDRDDMMDFIKFKGNFVYSQVDAGMTLYRENLFTTLGLRIFMTREDQEILPIFDIGLRF